MFVLRGTKGSTAIAVKRGGHYRTDSVDADISGLYIRYTPDCHHPDYNWFDYTDDINQARVYPTSQGAKSVHSISIKNGTLEVVEVRLEIV